MRHESYAEIALVLYKKSLLYEPLKLGLDKELKGVSMFLIQKHFKFLSKNPLNFSDIPAEELIKILQGKYLVKSKQ